MQVQPAKDLADVAAPPGTARWGKARVAALCALAALAVSLPTLRNDFAIDDFVVFVNQPSTHDLRNIPQFFTRGWGMGTSNQQSLAMNTRYYRPVPTALGALEYAVFGLRPAGFHLVSSLLHATTSALVSLLLWQLAAGSLTVALVGGLLFALHPVQSEAFCAACYQTSLLAGLFGAVALLAFGRVLRQGVRLGPWLILAVALLLGLMSKEEAFAVPLLATSWALVLRPAGWRKSLLASWLAMGIACAIVLALRSAFLVPSRLQYFPEGGPAWMIVLTMLRVAALYAEILILPLRLCPFYDWFIIGYETSLSTGVVLGTGVMLACLALVAISLRRAPSMALGVVWALLALLPVSQIVPIIVVAAERFLYIAMMGIALFAGVLARTFVERARAAGRGRLAVAAGVAVLVLAGGRTRARVSDWRNNETLNRATAEAFPETPTPLLNLAAYYYEVERDDDKALQALAKADERAPGWQPARARAAWIRSHRNR